MSIQEHLNKIRNAVYGREVRESIAKGIETAYDDASENGNANMEVKIARGTHPNLRSRLEEVDSKQQQTTAQLAKTVKVINASDFNLKDDGTDQSANLQHALDYASQNNYAKVYIPEGEFVVENVTVPSRIKLVGASAWKTILKTRENTVHCLKVEAGATRVEISNLRIVTDAQTFGVDNAGIFFDKTQGAKESVIRNVTIVGFKHGISVANFFWYNLIEQVRVSLCDISFYSDGEGGNSINNLFIQFYSDKALTGGMLISSFKNSEFINCNFGGRKGTDALKTYAFRFVINSKSMKITSANFEHHNAPDNQGLIQVFSGSSVSIDTSNFFNFENVDATAYLIRTNNTSRTSVTNCSVIQPGNNVSGIYMLDDSMVFVNNNDDLLNDINNQSSHDYTFVNQNGSKLSGSTETTSDAWVETGLSRRPKNVQITLVTDGYSPTVIYSVADTSSNGWFKVRFVNISDGTLNTDPQIINWSVY